MLCINACYLCWHKFFTLEFYNLYESHFINCYILIYEWKIVSPSHSCNFSIKFCFWQPMWQLHDLFLYFSKLWLQPTLQTLLTYYYSSKLFAIVPLNFANLINIKLKIKNTWTCNHFVFFFFFFFVFLLSCSRENLYLIF